MLYGSQYSNRGQYMGQELKAEAIKQLGLSLTVASFVVGLMVTLDAPSWLYFVGNIGEVGILVALLFTALFGRNISETTATLLLYAFAVFSAITLSYVVEVALYLNPFLVVYAFGITTVLVFGAYLINTRYELNINRFWKYLAVLVIGFFIFSLAGLFIVNDFDMYILIVSVISAVIFTLYLLVDFARLEQQRFSSASLMALWLFYDIVYLFRVILTLFILGEDR